MQLAVTSILVSFALFVGFSVLTALSFSEYQQSLLDKEDGDELEFNASLTFKQKIMINISSLAASWFFVFGTAFVVIVTLDFILRMVYGT